MEDAVIISWGNYARRHLLPFSPHFIILTRFRECRCLNGTTDLIKRSAARLSVLVRLLSVRGLQARSPARGCGCAASCLNTSPPPASASAFVSLFLLTTVWQWGEMGLKATVRRCAALLSQAWSCVVTDANGFIRLLADGLFTKIRRSMSFLVNYRPWVFLHLVGFLFSPHEHKIVQSRLKQNKGFIIALMN